MEQHQNQRGKGCGWWKCCITHPVPHRFCSSWAPNVWIICTYKWWWTVVRAVVKRGRNKRITYRRISSGAYEVFLSRSCIDFTMNESQPLRSIVKRFLRKKNGERSHINRATPNSDGEMERKVIYETYLRQFCMKSRRCCADVFVIMYAIYWKRMWRNPLGFGGSTGEILVPIIFSFPLFGKGLLGHFHRYNKMTVNYIPYIAQ